MFTPIRTSDALSTFAARIDVRGLLEQDFAARY